MERKKSGYRSWFFPPMRYNREMKKTCEICGGSGQVGHFGGVSRFIITWDECPQCLGTGIYTGDTREKAAPAEKSPPASKSRRQNSSDQ
jgi:DnaJ-class molecular chaperone